MKWIKKGHIFKPNGEFDWSKDYAQVPTPVILKDFYRIFFATRHYSNRNLPISSIGYVDLERNNPNKIFSISEFPVLKHGNLGSFDEFGQMPAEIIKIDEDTHYLYYTGWSRGESTPYITAIGLAVSKDNCKSFQKMYNGPILGINKYDPILVNGPSIVRKDDTYHMFYSSANKWLVENNKKEVFYYVKRATSKNGIDWEINDDLCLNTILEDEVQNTPRVGKVGNEYHMWFCYRKGFNFRNDLHSGYRLGLAISKDLINWNRIPDDLIGIEKSDKGWDSKMMCYPYLIKEKEKFILFYNGNYFGKEGFGYAELEID